jgi:hypothetical protein
VPLALGVDEVHALRRDEDHAEAGPVVVVGGEEGGEECDDHEQQDDHAACLGEAAAVEASPGELQGRGAASFAAPARTERAGATSLDDLSHS